MKPLVPLYFPGTTLDASTGLSLVSCFEAIQCLAPVAPLPDKTFLPPTDPFMDTGFCQVHIPCPLPPDDQKGFIYLLKEIRTHGSDFVSQLKMATIASVSTLGQQQKESSGGILSTLFSQTDSVRQEEDKQTALELWQARLILKLAEIIDLEDNSLSKQISSIDSLQDEMIQNLQGESDSDAFKLGFSKSPSSSAVISSEQDSLRLKSWLTLYHHWDAPEIPVWVCKEKTAAETLFETYENKQNQKAKEAFSLTLPTIGTADHNSIFTTLNEFRDTTAALRAGIGEQIGRLLTPVSTMKKEADDQDNEWREAVDTFFPQPQYGRIVLTATLLSDITFDSLLDKQSEGLSSHTNALLCSLDRKSH